MSIAANVFSFPKISNHLEFSSQIPANLAKSFSPIKETTLKGAFSKELQRNSLHLGTFPPKKMETEISNGEVVLSVLTGQKASEGVREWVGKWAGE